MALASGPVCARERITASSGYALVPVKIDGVDYPFVLDTGAEGSAVYPDFARTAGLPVGPPDALVGQTGHADVSTRTIASLSLDSRHVGPITAIELPRRNDRLNLAGIVGLDVMGSYILDLDMPRASFALHDRSNIKDLTISLGRPIRAKRVRGGLLAVPVMLNGKTGIAIIDTGARETRVNTAFSRAARLAATQIVSSDVRGATQVPIATNTARVRSAEFLGKHKDATTVRVVDLPVFADFDLADRPAMLLGLDWIKDHRLVIDFTSSRVWLR